MVGKGGAFAISVNKVGFFLCSQCVYLTQEMDALQEGSDRLPCSHLNARLWHGIWTMALGREQRLRKGEPHSHGPSTKHLGYLVPTVLSAPATDQVTSAGPFVAAGLLLPRVQSKSCASALFPTLPLQCWCTPATWQSSVQGWGYHLSWPCMGQVHHNI